MRRLMEHAGRPNLTYPLALLCHDINFPQAQVEKEIEEKRLIAFNGIGLSITPPINFNQTSDGCENPEEGGGVFFPEDKGNAVTIGVAHEYIGLVDGHGGRNLERISHISEASITVSSRGDFISRTTDRKVTITGSQRAIGVAEDMTMHKVDYAVEHHLQKL